MTPAAMARLKVDLEDAAEFFEDHRLGASASVGRLRAAAGVIPSLIQDLEIRIAKTRKEQQDDEPQEVG